jgi:hypothetical protein
VIRWRLSGLIPTGMQFGMLRSVLSMFHLQYIPLRVRQIYYRRFNIGIFILKLKMILGDDSVGNYIPVVVWG